MEFTESELVIDLKFDKPLEVSSNAGDSDKVVIHIYNSHVFFDEYGQELD